MSIEMQRLEANDVKILDLYFTEITKMKNVSMKCENKIK